MLNVHIIAIGRLKEPYLVQAAAEYQKRLGGKIKLHITEIAEARLRDNPSDKEIAAAVSAEGERILAALPEGCYVFSLAIEGNQLSSEEFSQRLYSAAAQRGTVAFIIGGSHGLSDEVKSRAGFLLSFSRLTLPHQLFRVVLLEQIYRAAMINGNCKYHK